jgi:hypothetical protein
MALPLLLAGPILRRVDPTLACVWLALRDRCDVRMKVWEGMAEAGTQSPPFGQSEPTPTLRVGKQLHLVVVAVEFPAASGKSFLPDNLYSYDLEISDGPGPAHTLASLHMLEEGTFDGFAHLPIGFEPNQLPSFAPPPSRLEDLNLLYGSCRRPGHETVDALALVDDLIKDGINGGDPDLWKDPRRRPHQLFLGGDQVYADDVDRLQFLMLSGPAVSLIGTTDDHQDVKPVEQLRVDNVAKLVNKAAVATDTPWLGYTVAEPVLPEGLLLPADRVHFPEGRRLDTTQIDAQLTSTDGGSHILSLGEFAALYLSVWSPALWGDTIPLTELETQPAPEHPGDPTPAPVRAPISWDQDLEEGAKVILPAIPTPKEVPANLYPVPLKPPDPRTPDEVEDDRAKEQRGLRKQFRIQRAFRRGLPKVQRALANVPTYMVLDDHDITDDYFLNPVWRFRVLKSKLGRSILDNGMIAYALFQDWGNEPRAYRAGPKAEFLSLVPQLFPEGTQAGPVQAAYDRISVLLGHDQFPEPDPVTGEYPPPDPPLRWHFLVDGPKHRVVAFDNRTRRSYVTRLGPPGNVPKIALLDQLPPPPLPAGCEILLVVAPLQVVGAPVLDDIVAPLSYRVTDAVAAMRSEEKFRLRKTSPSSPTGMRGMTGTDPDAIEAWAFDTGAFEHLMQRLEPYGRVVLLSGDVHYASGGLMSYWRGNDHRPARFAQFTSSGFKNVMPTKIIFVDRALALAQQLIRMNLGTERLAWERSDDDLVLFPPGRNKFDLRPVLRSKLGDSPVLVPTWGWPDDNDPEAAQPDPSKQTRLNPAKPPDWRWRIMPLLDTRPDGERPEGIQIQELDEAAVAAQLRDKQQVVKGYHAVAGRHQHSLGRMRNARQILFRGNVGRVTFTMHPDGRLDATHEVISAYSDDDKAPLKPEAFLVQVASLGPDDEDPPIKLRKKAL